MFEMTKTGRASAVLDGLDAAQASVGRTHREVEGRVSDARRAGLVSRATDELLGVAMALAGQGDSVRALRLAGAAYAEQEAIAKGSDVWWRSMQDRLIGGARSDLGPDEAQEAERAGRGLAFEAALDEVLE